MPKVTLYVPDELKARMDEVGEAANWSAIAQQAFRTAVVSHNMRKGPTVTENIIERLRASKQTIEDRDRERGKTCGVDWASKFAEYDELLRLSESDYIETVDELIAAIDDTDFYHDFLQEQYDEKNPSDAFAEGFAQGANEIFEEVEDKL